MVKQIVHSFKLVHKKLDAAEIERLSSVLASKNEASNQSLQPTQHFEVKSVHKIEGHHQSAGWLISVSLDDNAPPNDDRP